MYNRFIIKSNSFLEANIYAPVDIITCNVSYTGSQPRYDKYACTCVCIKQITV